MALREETVIHLSDKYFGRGERDLYDRAMDAYRINGTWLSVPTARNEHGEAKLEAVREAMEAKA